MKDDQEQRHCCRFCNKSFPCGRSLGGHMRSHMTGNNNNNNNKNNNNNNNNNHNNSSEAEDKSETRKHSGNGGSSSKSFVGFEGYGLRENPKKTWRLSDSSSASLQAKSCKECGKEFQSWKALFGHMRCHSDKSVRQDSSNRRQVLDSHSDNEGTVPSRRRRSRRTRYGASSPSFSIANGSSSVSEIEQEQEDVALSLMMLSRDVGSWAGTHSFPEFSDNNSSALEVRSSGIDKIFNKIGGDFVNKNSWKLHKGSELGVSDDGCLRNVAKKADSDVSNYVLERDYQLDKTRIAFEVSDAQMAKNSSKISKLDSSDVELGKGSYQKTKVSSSGGRKLSSGGRKFGKDLSNETEFDPAGSSKRARYDSYGAELGTEVCKKLKYEDSDNEIGKYQYSKSRYECTTCNKSFHSYQALGGHRASHKKVKGCFASKIESSENSFEPEFSPDPIAEEKPKYCKIESLNETGETSYVQKKIKSHECPICFKVFASGQALGGHKRSHMIGNSDSRPETCQSIVIQQQVPEIPDLLDLNLPAPVEEDNSGFKSWYNGNNHKHEPLVGLISN